MDDDVLLTEVRVRKHQLYQYFKDLGGAYRRHVTTYFTRPLGIHHSGDDKMRKLRERIAQNRFLAGYECRRFEKPFLPGFAEDESEYVDDAEGMPNPRTHFDVLQLFAPPGINELIRVNKGWKHLDEEFLRHKLPKEFHGNYALFARRTPCPPMRWGSMDADVRSLLEHRSAAEEELRCLEVVVDEALADAGVAMRSKTKRLLAGTGFTSLDLPVSILERRKELQYALDELKVEALSIGAGLNYIPPGERNGIHDEIIEVHLPDRDYFRPTRLMTPDELRELPWLVFDTESPLFKEHDQTVTWIPYAVIKDGAISERVIMTTNDPGVADIKGFRVVSFHGPESFRTRAERMTAAFADVAREFVVYSAYNAAYDFPTLRDMGDFEIGDRDSEPRIEVSLPAVRRVGVPGAIIFDPMRIAKMAYAHLPNAKANLVLARLCNTEPFKDISHDDLGPLEHMAMGHQVQPSPHLTDLLLKEGGVNRYAAACVLGSYAASDVEWLAQAHCTEFMWKKILDAAHKFVNMFESDYNRALHSPGSVNEDQNWCYLRNLGFPRELMYLPTKEMKQREAQARNRVTSYLGRKIDATAPEGLYDDVWLCKLPMCEWLGPLVARNYPPAATFFDWLTDVRYNRDGVGEGNPYYRQFLGAVGDALCKLIVADTGFMLQASDNFRDVMGERQLGDFLLAEHRLERTFSRKERWEYVKGKLSVPKLEHYLSDERAALWRQMHGEGRFDDKTLTRLLEAQEGVKDYLAAAFNGDTEEFFRHLQHSAAVSDKERKLAGNYNVHPAEVLALLDGHAEEANAYAQQQGIHMLLSDGRYVYVRGPADAITSADSPWIALEHLRRAFLSSKFSTGRTMYWSMHGYYKGLRTASAPAWQMCKAESAVYETTLEAILKCDTLRAKQEARDGLIGCIRRMDSKDHLDEFLFHSRSSDVWWYLGKAPDGTRSEDGKVLFRDSTPKQAGFAWDKGRWVKHKKLGKKVETMCVGELAGHKFYDEPLLVAHRDRQWHSTHHTSAMRRVWFMPTQDAQIDPTLYAQRMQERLIALLDPVMGGKAASWLRLRMKRHFQGADELDREQPLISEEEYQQTALDQGTLFEGAPQEKRRRTRTGV